MSKQTPAWGTAILVIVGVIFTVALGIYSFINAMWLPVHTDPQQVPSVIDTAPPPQWAAAVEGARQQARAALLEQNLPGLSVAVGIDGQIVWAEGFGWADLDARVAVTPRARFRIGHVSKTLTSAGVGLLIEQGRMRLADEIQTYLPAFPRKNWPITLRQAMGHLAGIRHYRSDTDYMPSSNCAKASEGLPIFADDPLLFEPETEYRYSTYGWVLVSAAVEAAANEPFFTFMRQRVFEPLQMTGTTVDGGEREIPDRVTFYYPRFSGDPASGADLASATDYSCFAGAGAFLSTPSDLVRFGIALGSGKLLKPSTVAQLQTPQLLASGQETEYGLGWMLNTVTLGGEPVREAGHASLTLLGGSTSFLTFPEHGVVVAVTSNISRASTRSIALRIAETFVRR